MFKHTMAAMLLLATVLAISGGPAVLAERPHPGPGGSLPQTLLGCHSIDLALQEYDADDDLTLAGYVVTEGCDQGIDTWVLGLPPEAEFSFNASEPFTFVNPDFGTGQSGVRFDEPLAAGESRLVLITMSGQRGFDLVPLALRTGNGEVYKAEIMAPLNVIDSATLPAADGIAWEVLFTTPGADDFSAETTLATAIDSALVSVDAAFFELDSPAITDALLRAAERGVTVRVVVDGEFGLDVYAADSSPDAFAALRLVEAGLPVVSDGERPGLMHNSFIVIDGRRVWTGTTVLTTRGLTEHRSSAVLIDSVPLAENYTAEFEELFAGEFGKTSPPGVPNPVITVGDTQIETFFLPEDDAPARLLELLNEAESVRFMMFSFTSTFAAGDISLMDVMRTRAVSGELDVQGVVEPSARRFAADLICDGLPIRQRGGEGLLNHSVWVLDDSIIVVGSMYFSKNAAETNDENLLIIHDSDLAAAYLAEFDRVWAAAESIPLADVCD